jgi:hypothetical protein
MSIKIQFTPADWKLQQATHAEAIAQVLNGVIEHCVNSMNCTQIETEQVIIKAMTGYADCVTGESYAVAKGIIAAIYEQKDDLNGGSSPGT